MLLLAAGEVSQERAVTREDIDRYRRALTDLGGEATLADRGARGHRRDRPLLYIASCLIVPELTHPTRASCCRLRSVGSGSATPGEWFAVPLPCPACSLRVLDHAQHRGRVGLLVEVLERARVPPAGGLGDILDG